MEDATAPVRSNSDVVVTTPPSPASNGTTSFSGSMPPSSSSSTSTSSSSSSSSSPSSLELPQNGSRRGADEMKRSTTTRNRLETQLHGMEREIERLLLLWQHEIELVERATSGMSPTSVTPRDASGEAASAAVPSTGAEPTTPRAQAAEDGAAAAHGGAVGQKEARATPADQDEVEEELRRIDMEMEQLQRRRREMENLRLRSSTSASEEAAESRRSDAVSSCSNSSSADTTPRGSIDGDDGVSTFRKRGSKVQPSQRARNPTISLGSERVVTTANGVMSSGSPPALSTSDGRSLSTSPNDNLTQDLQSEESPHKFRRSRSFVLPTSVKGGDLVQALKAMAEAEGVDLPDVGSSPKPVSPGRSTSMRSTSMGSGESDPLKMLSFSRRQRSSSASGSALASVLSPSTTSTSPRSPSALNTTSASPPQSSATPSSSSRRSHFLTFRRRGKDHNGTQSVREEGRDRLMSLFAKEELDKDSEKVAGDELPQRTGSKSLRMHFGPWLKDEAEKGARDEKRKSKGNKSKHQSVGKEEEEHEDATDNKQAALDAYQRMENARWEGYAKDAIDMLDDNDSGFYHLNLYFLASNREQARQFYACLERFLQQFDAVAQTDKANGVLGPLWITAPKVVHRPTGEVERDLG